MAYLTRAQLANLSSSYPDCAALHPASLLTNYFGADVSRTGHIEPVTPPGEVYVTE